MIADVQEGDPARLQKCPCLASFRTDSVCPNRLAPCWRPRRTTTPGMPRQQVAGSRGREKRLVGSSRLRRQKASEEMILPKAAALRTLSISAFACPVDGQTSKVAVAPKPRL